MALQINKTKQCYGHALASILYIHCYFDTIILCVNYIADAKMFTEIMLEYTIATCVAEM